MIIKLTAFWPCWVFKICLLQLTRIWLTPFFYFLLLFTIYLIRLFKHTCFKNVCILHWFPTINTTTIMFEIAIASFFFNVQCSHYRQTSNICWKSFEWYWLLTFFPKSFCLLEKVQWRHVTRKKNGPIAEGAYLTNEVKEKEMIMRKNHLELLVLKPWMTWFELKRNYYTILDTFSLKSFLQKLIIIWLLEKFHSIELWEIGWFIMVKLVM